MRSLLAHATVAQLYSPAVLAGVDGCARGWVVVLCDARLGSPEARFIERLVELPRGLAVAAVDIPIGLPERGARDADVEARAILGRPRGSSVFPSPFRPVLGARTWEEACRRRERVDGHRLPRQTFNLLRKIEEVDHLLRTEAWARRIIREVHPELSFATWADAPMKHAKKTRAGRAERQALIAGAFGARAFARGRASVRGHHVAADDLADAFAAAWSAARIAAGQAARHPARRQRDAEGIPMNIWA